MNKDFRGALAGTLATIPMSIMMLWWHKQLPKSEQYPLPPREIVEEVLNKTDLEHTSNASKSNLTVLAHFLYGAASGVVYSRLISNFTVSPIQKGAVFGLSVWTVSYLGLLPGLNILSPATSHPYSRNILMIKAHLVWGISLGLIEKNLRK